MTSPNSPPARGAFERYDLWIVAGLATLLLGALAPLLGIWEPWEADAALAAETMRSTGNWLRVQLPVGGDKFHVVPELPFGWWPAAASTAAFGAREAALRLPGLVLGVVALALLFSVTRRFFGRTAAWFAALCTLCMPLFGYHTRLALGAGVEMAFAAISALAFLRCALDDDAGPAWTWAAWLGLAASGLAGGLPGLAVPLVVAAASLAARLQAHGAGRMALVRRVVPPLPAAIAVALVALGWWRTIAHQPEGASLAALLLWSDPVDTIARKVTDRPSFDAFVHQIGFGLFPFGAFVPFAFGTLLWGDARDDEPLVAGYVAPALGAWFAAAFLLPALTAPYSQHALFLGAPVVGIAVGVYFARVLRSPPQPLLLVCTVLLVALLDSNLKHETHFLADVLVGARVDAFPPELRWWGVARGLDFALLGVLILYQGGLHRWFVPAMETAVRAFGAPLRDDLRTLRGVLTFRRAQVPPGHVGVMAIFALVAVGASTLILVRSPEWLVRRLQAPEWGRLVPWARMAIVAVVLAALFYLLLRVASLLRPQRRGRFLTRAADQARRLVLWRPARYATLVGVIAGWAVFLNVVVAGALTANFSQKDILHRYGEHADEEEPLFKYRVSQQTSSFYTRSLPELDARQFREKANGSERFFAIIPRDKLADINTEFRRITQRTLPVLHDRSYRYLLVSNQLEDGEEDRNPIKRALMGELPAGATPVSINFDDKIELVGWQLEPAQPKVGSPVTISLFWRAKTEVPGRWKVFVHIDAPGQRIHGDHDPVEGLFPTSDWRKGDLVRDDHRVVVQRTISPAQFTFYAGLYQGNKRMPIKSGPKDREDRARLGNVRIR